jgi:proteasome assembly chaperone (PAC2) family protein
MLIAGFSGYGDVGRITVELLAEFVKAQKFAELFSPSLPDYVDSNGSGVCELPRLDFRYWCNGNIDLILLCGNDIPAYDDPEAIYDLCDRILEFIRSFSCRRILAISGYPTSNQSSLGRIFVASSSAALVRRYQAKGASIFVGKRIVGMAGVLLGLAKTGKMSSVAILSGVRRRGPGRPVALRTFRFLCKALDLEATGRA